MTTLMFHKRFVEPIKAGRKRHTIRRNGKRKIPVGADLSLRHWEGQGYRSPQVEFGTGVCTDVIAIRVSADGVKIGRGPVYLAEPVNLDEFAQSDGFHDWADMMDYYREQKIPLPFDGVIIEWRDR